jgi:hypothetical protein
LISQPERASEADSAPHPARRAATAWLWLLLLPVVLIVYAASFSTFPIIEREHSILGDADAANYVLLLQTFRIDRKLGNEWNPANRTVGDIAQKHKVHHVVYAVAGSALYRVLRPVYGLFGLPRDQAVYAVNAVFAALNLVLLWLLLRRRNPRRNPIAPFLLFYAAALSTWVVSSVPESWPFSATLVLLLLLLLRRRPLRPALLGAALGVLMLNNVFLAALGLLIFLEVLREGGSLGLTVRRTAIAAAMSLVTWLGALTALSVFDHGFRPDEFVRYTIWFKQLTGKDLPVTSPYVWKSASTNLLVNSIVSNQPDPRVPQEALQSTLQQSPLGMAAIIAWVVVLAVAGIAFLRLLWLGWQNGRWRGVIETRSLDAAVWCVTMFMITAVLFYSSGFLYSTVVVPVLALFLCWNLDLRKPWQAVLFGLLLVLMVVNNTQQVLAFRDALAAMS